MEQTGTDSIGDGKSSGGLDVVIAERLSAKAISGRSSGLAAGDYAYVGEWSDGRKSEVVEAASLLERLRDKGGPASVVRVRLTPVSLDAAFHHVLASDNILVNLYATISVVVADPLRVADALDPERGSLGVRQLADTLEVAAQPHLSASMRRWTSAEVCDAPAPPPELHSALVSAVTGRAESLGLQILEIRQLSLQRSADAKERAEAVAALQSALREVANRDRLNAARSEEDMRQVVRQLAHERDLQEALQEDELADLGIKRSEDAADGAANGAASEDKGSGVAEALEARVARLEARMPERFSRRSKEADGVEPSFRSRLRSTLDRVKNFWGAVSATLVVISVVFGVEPLSLGQILEQIGLSQLTVQLILWALAFGSLYVAWRTGERDGLPFVVPNRGAARTLEERVRRLAHGYTAAAIGHLATARREAFTSKEYAASKALDGAKAELDGLLAALHMVTYSPDAVAGNLTTELRGELSGIEEQLLDGGEAIEGAAKAVLDAALRAEFAAVPGILIELRTQRGEMMGLLHRRYGLTA